MEKEKNKTLALAASEIKRLFLKHKRSGTSPFTVEFRHGPEKEGYSVRLEKQNLVFEYSAPVEALYAVYDFAEEYLGYCFFEPGKEPIAPGYSFKIKSGTLLDPRKPLIKRRGFVQEFPFDKNSYILADWMAKNKLNYLLTWMKYYDKMPAKLKQYFMDRGIEIESGHHNFSYWIPGEKYARKNPEYFAVRNGKRINPSSSKSALLLGEQLCVTNQELRREIVRRMSEYRKNNPEVKTLSLIPNDGFGWCECEKCSKFYDANRKGDFYSVSEHVYKADKIYHDMVGDIAGQLRKKRPDTNLTFAAYVNYCAPSPGFKLKKGLAVHFAPYWRCINHNINDKNCYTNSSYFKDLKAWLAARNGGEVNIYEYYMGINFYISLPMIHHEKIFEEIDLYHRLGVDGLLTQFHLPHWTAYGLNYYMMAKACWNTEGKQEVSTALKKLFGAKAGDARKFYHRLRKLQESAERCLIPYPRGLLRRTKTGAYRKIYEASKKLAKGFPEDSLPARLPAWTEYMLRFKGLFDAYHNGKAGRKDVEKFIRWCENNSGKKIVVIDRLKMLFGAWLECLDKNREWIHFNLDWEDKYVLRHDKSLS